MSDAAAAGARPRLAATALAVALFGLALTLPGLGDSGLWDPWEPVYAQTAREMAERGDWILPYHRGAPRLNRPPMTYWLIGASQALFGVTEAAARLPSAWLAVLGAAGLGLAFAARGRALEGVLAAGALLTSPQWLLLGRSATLSMPLGAALAGLLALALAWPTIRGRWPRFVAGSATVVLLGMAALANWPRGLMLPAWAVLGHAAVSRPRAAGPLLLIVAALYHAGQLTYRPELTIAAFVAAIAAALVWLAVGAGVRPRTLLLGAVATIVLVAPWFLAVAGAPVEQKLWNYKYALNLGESPGEHTGPYSFVLRTLALGALPWAAAAVVGLVRGFGRRADEIARLLAGVLLGGFLFFVLAESRMGHFTSALQPAVAGLAAVGLAHVTRRRDWTFGVAAVALAGLAFWAAGAPERVLETLTVRRSLLGLDPSSTVLAAVVVWGLVVTLAWWRGKPSWALAAVLPAAVLSGVFAHRVVPALSNGKSTRALWSSYVAARGEDEPLGLLGRSEASVFYYSNNRVVRIDEPWELREFLDGDGVRYLIVEDSWLERLGTLPAPGAFEPVDRSHLTHTLVRFTPAAPRLPEYASPVRAGGPAAAHRPGR